jgi:hypothetical protein
MAEWVRFNYPDREKWDRECSECGNLQTFRTKTCKRCRADMGDGIEERGKDADSDSDNRDF